MAVKRTGQLSFAEALMPAARQGQLDRLTELVKWYRFEKLVGALRDETSPGRPGWPALNTPSWWPMSRPVWAPRPIFFSTLQKLCSSMSVGGALAAGCRPGWSALNTPS